MTFEPKLNNGKMEEEPPCTTGPAHGTGWHSHVQLVVPLFPILSGANVRPVCSSKAKRKLAHHPQNFHKHVYWSPTTNSILRDLVELAAYICAYVLNFID